MSTWKPECCNGVVPVICTKNYSSCLMSFTTEVGTAVCGDQNDNTMNNNRISRTNFGVFLICIRTGNGLILMSLENAILYHYLNPDSVTRI